MFIFQSTLDKTNRIAVARIDSNSIEYETTNVAGYKTTDTFHIIISEPSFMTNVSLILKSRSEGSFSFRHRVRGYEDAECTSRMVMNSSISWILCITIRRREVTPVLREVKVTDRDHDQRTWAPSQRTLDGLQQTLITLSMRRLELIQRHLRP